MSLLSKRPPLFIVPCGKSKRPREREREREELSREINLFMHATIGTGTNGTIDTRGPGSHGKLKEKK